MLDMLWLYEFTHFDLDSKYLYTLYEDFSYDIYGMSENFEKQFRVPYSINMDQSIAINLTNIFPDFN